MIVTPIGWILGMRNTMIMNLNEDYIKLAKAKGLPDRVVALRYAARNALLPSVTGFALALGGVLGGTILVETVFDYPGLGRLMGEAVGLKDYPLLQTLMLLTAVGDAGRQPDRRPAVRRARPASPEGRGMRHAREVTPMTTAADGLHGRGRTRTSSRPSRRSATPSARRPGTASSGAARRPGSASSSCAIYVLVAIFAPLIAPVRRRTDGSLRAAGSAVAAPIRWAPTSAARTSCPS